MNYIYLITDMERRWVKVGVSEDPFARLKQLNNGQAPFPLHLLACFVVDDAYAVEKTFHKELTDRGYHHHGEWFTFTAAPEVIRTVAFLTPTYPLFSPPTNSGQERFNKQDNCERTQNSLEVGPL